MEMLGVDPLDLDFDELELLVMDERKDEPPAAAAAAGFNIASF